ncbi:uncharacterized protein J3R85_016601 [Psidium guajava]|nr:uncharacterized protein J3R85_016601 [Psidium guajava]
MTKANHLTSHLSTLFDLARFISLFHLRRIVLPRSIRRSRYPLLLHLEIMYSSNGPDGYPQKPGASTPPPPPVNGIPVQPDYYGVQNNPQPAAGLHARPINNVPWSSGLCSCSEDVPTCKSAEFFLSHPFRLEVDGHLIEQLCPCVNLLGDVGCLSFWCPCVTFGRIAEILDHGSVSCAVHGALYALINVLTGCGCCYSCLYRTKMRHQHKLQEEPCNDCLVHFCCECCALTQEYRELERRGFDMSLGWHGNMAIQNRGIPMAPVPPGGMMR